MWELPSCRIECTKPMSTISFAECKSITESEACATSALIRSRAMFRVLSSHQRVLGLCGWNDEDNAAGERLNRAKRKKQVVPARVNPIVPVPPPSTDDPQGTATPTSLQYFHCRVSTASTMSANFGVAILPH